jgi:hypothetical protein
MLMKYMPLLLSDWNLTMLTESNFLLEDLTITLAFYII